MNKVIPAADFRKMAKKGSFKTGTKGNGGKAKSEIEWVMKQTGMDYQKEFRFHPVRKWRFDFAIPEIKLAIEYEGIIADKSRHTNIKGYTEDANKYNEAQKLGWKVLRYTALNYINLINDLSQIL